MLNSQPNSDSKGSQPKNTAATPSDTSKSNLVGSFGGLTSSTTFASSMTPNRSSNQKNVKYGMKHYESNPTPGGHTSQR